MVHFYANNQFMQITGMRLPGLFSSGVNGFVWDSRILCDKAVYAFNQYAISWSRLYLQMADITEATIEPVLDGSAICSRDVVMEDESHCHTEEVENICVRTQPCLTPVFTPKLLDISPPCTTRALISVWTTHNMLRKCGQHPNLPMTSTADHNWRCQKPL